MRVPPSQSSTCAPISASARSGSFVRSVRVTRVSRVPNTNVSTRRPAAIAAYANCINAREYGAIDPLMSRISTSGRLRVVRSRQARSNGSPWVRSDRRSVRRTSNRRPLGRGPGPAGAFSGHADRERPHHGPHPGALVLGELAERLRPQHLVAARHDPDRALAVGLLLVVLGTEVVPFGGRGPDGDLEAIGLLPPVERRLVADGGEREFDREFPGGAQGAVPVVERQVVGREVVTARHQRRPAGPVERRAVGQAQRRHRADEREDAPGAHGQPPRAELAAERDEMGNRTGRDRVSHRRRRRRRPARAGS